MVRGSINPDGSAHASSIEYDAEIEGTISAIDTESLTILGLMIAVNADTIYDQDLAVRSLDGLATGNYVEISALTTVDGYLATRIDVETDDGEVEVYGKVTGLDSSASTFMIHDLMVDYSGASFDDFNGKTLADGDYVEVEGNGFGGAGELVATSVEFKDHNPYDDGDEGQQFEIEGLITSFDGNTLVVGDVTFLLGPDVTFEHGSVLSFGENVKVEVEGELDALGNLVVHEIEFKIETNIEVEAPVDAINGNVITVLGLNFTVTDTTQYEDSSTLDETFFHLSGVMPGDWVEIKAFQDATTGGLVAVRIEREDAGDEVELKAPLDGRTGNVLTLLGIDVITSANTVLDEDSEFASVDAFLNNVSVGTVIEVEGTIVAIDGSPIEIMVNEIDD